LIFKGVHFVEELKSTSKETIILNVRDDFSTVEDDESVQDKRNLVGVGIGQRKSILYIPKQILLRKIMSFKGFLGCEKVN